jgi:hypothetical protein
LALAAMSQVSGERCKIYYIEFGLKTYFGVTEKTIEDQASFVAESSDGTLYAEFRKLVTLKQGVRPSPNRTRLKIVRGKDMILFDAEGRSRVSKDEGVSEPRAVEALVRKTLKAKSTKIIKGAP